MLDGVRDGAWKRYWTGVASVRSEIYSAKKLGRVCQIRITKCAVGGPVLEV